MQALKSCYTSSLPLHIENEGAGEGGDRKGHADSLAQGSAGNKQTLEQKGDRASTSKFNMIFVWGVINTHSPS